MKNYAFIVLLLLLSSSFAFAKTPDYSGNWTLDFKQSKNLPPFYANVKNHKLVVSQTEKTVNVAVEINGTDDNPLKLKFIYNLDGSETATESNIKTPAGIKSVPTKLKAETAENSNLKVTITRIIEMPDGDEFKATTIENWALSADGKTLTIHRTDDTPQGRMQADLVFVKN